MKNTLATLFSVLSLMIAPAFVSLVPAISSAQGVGQINGNGNASQKLSTTTGVTTMHMDIVTDQGVHTFQWDNTPWRVDQGGTGRSSFTAGALLYGNGTSPLGEIAPGNQGDVLQFNGTLPTWVAPWSLGIVAQAAGSDGEIQFNSSGNLSSDSRLSWGNDQYGNSMLTIGGSGTSTIYGECCNTTSKIGGGEVMFTGRALNFNDGYEWYIDASGPNDGLYLFAPLASSVVSFASPGTGQATFDISSISNPAKRVFSFPDYDGTFGLLEADQKWTGTNTFSKGTAATTTVNFGEMGDATSHVCFNTKNTDGADISFYFVATSMVVENNVCQ